jgi:hypothetical protein
MNRILSILCITIILTACHQAAARLTPDGTSDTPAPSVLSFSFDGLTGLPEEWEIQYANFTDGVDPEITTAGVLDDRFVIENPGIYSALYAIYTRDLPASYQFSLELHLDGIPPVGIFLACRHTNAGWYQFHLSGGGSSIQRVNVGMDGGLTVEDLGNGAGFWLDPADPVIHRAGAVCSGDLLQLLVDGQPLVSTIDTAFPEGGLGFGVEALDLSGGCLAFDNLVIELLE